MESLIGQTLGQYQLVEQIGKGGMATVYKAFQPGLNRYVAVKVLPPYYAHEAGFAERFTREAQAIAHLDHPHILPIHDFGRQGEISYLVMKYVPAGTLRDRLGQPLAPLEAVELIEQIAGALDFAHQRGILHRDVKPGNILIDNQGWTYLSDFGLAKIVESSVQLTGSGVGVGTPAYMSPEQGQGLAVDARTDVYALGVILFEMLTGHVPYEAETPMAVVIKHITDPIPIPRQINPNIPEAVNRVLLKALAKNREDRFASAGALAAALRQAVQGLDPYIAAAPIAPATEATMLHRSGSPPSQAAAPPSGSYAAPATVQLAQPGRLPWLLLGTGAVVALLCGLGLLAGWFYFNRSGLPAAVSVQTPVLPTLIPTAALPVATPPASTPQIELPAQSAPPEETSTLTATPTPLLISPAPTPSSTPTATPPPVSSGGETGQAAVDAITPTCPSPQYFGDVWQAQPELGCPSTALTSDFTFQAFAGGIMAWQKSPSPATIYVLFNEGRWERVTDPGGSPQPACPEATQTGGLGPIFSFGKLWCENPNWRSRLGQPAAREQPGQTNPLQNFENGTILKLDATAKGVVILFADSRWVAVGGSPITPATPTPTPTPTLAPTLTPTPAASTWTDTGRRPNGRLADLWTTLGAGQSPLGYPIADPMNERLCARQNFERGYLLWVESSQKPDFVWAAVMPNRADNSGGKTYRFTDTWPGSPEYSCDEAAARAPLGPRRGFGMLWCNYPALRTDIGAALDEEIGGPDYPRCEVQLFQGGVMAHVPLDQAYWVFIESGGWYRFGE